MDVDDSGFKLNYSWEDLRPVHPLFITVLITQLAGAVVSLLLQGIASWFETAWLGGALATFPGYLIGLVVQRYIRPGSIALHRSMVIFMGAISLFLFVVALISPRNIG